MLLSGDDTLNAVGVFQMIVDEFYDTALEELKAATQCIYDYLLVAAGHDKALDIYGQKGSTRSQLACNKLSKQIWYCLNGQLFSLGVCFTKPKSLLRARHKCNKKQTSECVVG